MRKFFLSLLFFILISVIPCRQAAGQYYLNQNIPQVVRYIQGSQQYILKAAYVITGIEEAKTSGSGRLLQNAEGKFVIVRFKASNKSAMPAPSIILLDIILVDSKKNRWEQSLSATGSVRLFKNAEIAVDGDVEDAVVFDVPENIKDYLVLLPGGAKVFPVVNPDIAKITKSEEQKTTQADSGGRSGVKATIIVNAAHMYLKPSLESKPVTWSLKGTVFEVTGEFREGSGRKWYKIKAANGREYWIVGRMVKIKEDAGAGAVEDKRQAKEEKAAAKPEIAKAEVKTPAPVKLETKPEAKPASEISEAAKPGRKGKISVKVLTNAATLRTQPSAGAEPAGWVSKGTSFDVIDVIKDNAGRKWYKVKSKNGKTGWLRDMVVSVERKAEVAAADSIMPATEAKAKEKVDEKAKEETKETPREKTEDKSKNRKTATIIENAAHLRLKPSLESNPVTWSLKGTAFEVTGEFREGSGRKWYKVKAANGREYWIVGRMVKIKEERKAEEAIAAKKPGDAMPEVKPFMPAKPEEKPPVETKTAMAKAELKRPWTQKPEEKPAAESLPGAGWKRTASIIVKTVVLREKPSFGSEKVGKAAKGAVFEVIDEFTEASGRKWYKVKAPKGRESWIPDNVANISPFNLVEDKFIENGMAVVEPEDKETKKKVIESMKGEWVEKSGKGEHIRGKTITVNREFAILRAEPAKSSRVITWSSKGAVFEVLDETTDSEGMKWYKVRTSSDVECWIADSMISLTTSGPDGKGHKTAGKNKKTEQQKEQMDAVNLKKLLDEAGVFYKEGKCENYVNNYEKAIKIAARQHDPAAEGKLHFNVAECYVVLKKYEDAIQHLDDALAIAEKAGDMELEMLSFIGKNRALIIALDRRNAAEIFKKISERLDRDIYLNISASDSLRSLVSFQTAYVLLDIGDVKGARERLDYALMVNHNFKMEDDIINLMKTIDISAFEEAAATDKMLEGAWSYYEKGNFRDMEELALLALDRAKRLRYKRGMFSGSYYLAMALSNTGESKRAMDYVQSALEIAEKGGDEMSMGMAYNLTGNIYKQENVFDKALYYCDKYLDIARKSGNREGEALALNNIGNLLIDKGDYAFALKYYEDSLKVIIETGSSKYLLAQGYLSMGRAYKKLGNYVKAEENIVAAKNIFKDLGNKGGELTGIWEMAGNYGLRGEYESAIKILEDNLSRSEGTVLEKNFIEDLIEYAEKSNDSERAEKYRKMKGS